jgi:septal ring factor EnvC (AmiA/AmiB activator)
MENKPSIPIEVEDLQKQVRDHIKDDLFDWDEALTGEEMIFLEQLLLTFAPMFSPGSIGFGKTVKPYISKLEADLKEKEGEIKKQTNLKTEYKEMYQNACAKIADLEKELEELRMENENLQSDLKEGYD